jgi:chemotaxis protein MotB
MIKRASGLTMIAVVLAAGCVSGCVTRAEHERLMDLAAARERDLAHRAAMDLAGAQARIVSLQNEVTRLTQELAKRDGQISDGQVQIAALQRKLDDATLLADQLKHELKKAGKNVDQLLAEKGQMSQALQDAKARLEELRKAQEASQKRAELLKSLVAKFKKMIDAGDLKIVMRDGRMVLQLRNDVLFDSGKVDLKPAGKDALQEVAGVLTTLTDRKLQVVGHTDNRPIATERFPSNWELSAARAISVVKFLGTQGVKAEMLSAAGYSEHDPVASNDNDEGRAKNRRIEIVLQPNLSELVAVPD